MEPLTMAKILETLSARLAAVTLAALGALLPLPAVAQATPDWVQTTPNAYGRMIALDKVNNAYIAGSDPLASTMLITKLSPTGARLWQRIFDNPGTSEQSTWVTVDAAGNAIVTGYMFRTLNGDPTGLIVLKYDPAGKLLWQDVIGSPFGYAWRASTDSANNVYMLGRAFLTNASGNTTNDVVTIKYAPDGTRQWQRSLGFDDFSSDAPTSMALTPAGHVIVTAGRLAAAYDPVGNPLWRKVFETSSAALDVAVGPIGEFYIVGGTYSFATSNTFLVTKFDLNFNELWRRTYKVGHYGSRVVVDSKGNTIVAGIAGNGYADWMTIKLDPSGNLLWSRSYDQHFNDEIPYAMVVGPDDAVYITGQGGPGPTSGELSYLRNVTVKYTLDGAQVWSATTFDSVRGRGVKLGTDGGLFVVGDSPQTVFNYTQASMANEPPVAVATAITPTSGRSPLTVGFSSAGSGDPDGTMLSYRWSFGDGRVSLEANPTHTYDAGDYTAGNYLATLTVTDNRGGAATSAPIAIAAAPPLATPSFVGFDPSTVKGGLTTIGTVAVSSARGVVVALTSSNTRVATVPASVQVPAGSTSATFTVKTSRVKALTSVTISASANNGFANGMLTVVPR
jgi:PKD domain